MPRSYRFVLTMLGLSVILGQASGCAVVRRRIQARATARAEERQVTTPAPGVVSGEIPTSSAGQVPGPTAEIAYSGAPPPAFGMLAVVAGGVRYLSEDQTIALVADSGGRYMRINLRWGVSEARAGELSFNTDNDRKIALIENAGLRLFPVLSVGQGWMNDNRAGDNSRSYPPDDLSTVWSDQFGYSPSYYNFVFQFFSHYRGHFDYVVIENEANSAIFWGGTADEYVRLIKTAYKAIKSADPDVTVADSGFVSTVWGLCIAEDYLRTGLLPRDQVVEMMIAYYSAETSNLRIQSAADLDRTLEDARIQEQCRRVNVMLGNMGGSVDAINFHFYEDYRVMRYVVDWIRLRTQRAGYAPGVITHEIGQRGPDAAFAAGEAHARAVFKKLITGLSLGLEGMVWFSADTIGTRAPSPDKLGLFGDGGSIRPAARTFKLVAETLGAGYRFKTALASGPSLFHYVFEDAGNAPSLEAVWTEGGGQTLSLAAPPGRTQAEVTDYAGRAQTLAVSNGSVQLTLGDAPVFVAWR